MNFKAVLSSALMLGVFLLGAHANAQDVPEANPYSGDEAKIRSGKSDYRAICSLCHGGRADGAGERGTGASTPADLRKFNKGFRRYVDIVKNGVQKPGRDIKDMPAWGGVIDDETIYKIGAFLETLAIEGADWKEGKKN